MHNIQLPYIRSEVIACGYSLAELSDLFHLKLSAGEPLAGSSTLMG